MQTRRVAPSGTPPDPLYAILDEARRQLMLAALVADARDVSCTCAAIRNIEQQVAEVQVSCELGEPVPEEPSAAWWKP